MNSLNNKRRRDETSITKAPSNFGKAWTDKDKQILLDNINFNDDYVSVSQQLKRSRKGIFCQLRSIAYNMVIIEHKTIDEAVQLTKLNIDDITSWIAVKAAEQRYETEVHQQQPINTYDTKLRDDIMQKVNNSLAPIIKTADQTAEILACLMTAVRVCLTSLANKTDNIQAIDRNDNCSNNDTANTAINTVANNTASNMQNLQNLQDQCNDYQNNNINNHISFTNDEEFERILGATNDHTFRTEHTLIMMTELKKQLQLLESQNL